jgi:dTMP kinase
MDRFIAFEGADGCGKSTQMDRLAQWLEARGERVVKVREPGSTELGERIRSILLDGSIPMTVEGEALLFFSSRCQLLSEVIEPAVERGDWILADRFYLSTIVYQGLAGDLGEERVVELCQAILGSRRPALHLILDLPTDLLLERLRLRAGEGDRFESREGMIERTAEAFRSVRGLSGDRVERIDAVGTEDEVAARIQTIVESLWVTDRTGADDGQ